MPERQRSSLMAGDVMHRRVGAVAHGFRYRLAMCRIDLDELDALDRRLWLFGVGRARPMSYHAADHRTNVRALLAGHGITAPVRRIELVTHCRIFGYVFNPISFFLCYTADDVLAAIVCEVNNTFGDTHAYVVPVTPGRQDWDEKKVLHVSPFFTLDGTYRFRFDVSPDRFAAGIDLYRGGSLQFVSRLALDRLPLTDAAIARTLVAYPLVTAKVTAAIHWEALRLWWKGARYRARPAYDPESARHGTES
jgi:hypothetical protein